MTINSDEVVSAGDLNTDIQSWSISMNEIQILEMLDLYSDSILYISVLRGL